MEDSYNLTAIILNRGAFNEDDGRVTLYCRERGKLDLIVRGMKKIKSKLAGHLEPLTLSKVMAVRGRRHDYVGAAASCECYAGLKSDLNKLRAAGQALNVFNRLVKPGQADEELFILLNDFLRLLNNYPQAGRLPLASFFVFKLLAELGYKPELNFCLSCGKKLKPDGNLFVFSRGGLSCPACDPKSAGRPVSSGLIKILRLALKEDLTGLIKLKINDKLNKETEGIIGSFLQYHLD